MGKTMKKIGKSTPAGARTMSLPFARIHVESAKSKWGELDGGDDFVLWHS